MRTVLFLFFLVPISMVAADKLKVYGTLRNAQTGNVLIGCSVFNLTKQVGTITNEEGYYTIWVEKGDVIQYSYIGMLPVERTIVEETELNIEMKYLVKKIKDIIISDDNRKKNSVLYNKNYSRNKNNKWAEPTRKTAQDIMREAAPRYSPAGVSFSPITLLYYALNKKEQRRLKAVKDIQNLDASNQKYSLDFISMITSVDDMDELRDIKAHCYFPHELVLQSSYYELGIMLKECYVSYLIAKKEKENIKQPARDTLPKD